MLDLPVSFVRPSFVRPLRFFIRIGSLAFSDFLYEVRKLQMVKSDEARFFGKNLFYPNLGKKGPKARLFWNFFLILSSIFPKSNAK